ncbi:unnamed protein product [Blepharisma stoltei]|uniref:Uncharacterized protein n=1 Tax=Blepharisma stoltei TaxID=1481888 RepID=A0AAU9IS40_9CILI|nr:unnamed protein product [Blepharisma stoltei]
MENLIYFNSVGEYSLSYIEQEFSCIKSLIPNKKLKDIEWRNIHIPIFKSSEYLLSYKKFEIESKHLENLFYAEKSFGFENYKSSEIISIQSFRVLKKKQTEILLYFEEIKNENNLNVEHCDINYIQTDERCIDILVDEKHDKKKNQWPLQNYVIEFFQIAKPEVNLYSQTLTVQPFFLEIKNPQLFYSLSLSLYSCSQKSLSYPIEILRYENASLQKPLIQIFQCSLRIYHCEIKPKLLCYIETKTIVPKLCIDNSTFTSSPRLQFSECDSIEIQDKSYSKEDSISKFDTKTIEQKVISIQRWWKGIKTSNKYLNKKPSTPKFNGNIAKLFVTETFWHSVIPETKTKHSKSQDLNISSISVTSTHSIESTKGRRCKFNKAYVRNINALIPALQKLINKHNKMGFWKLQSTMPKYLRRRYYSIQKGIKAIIGICITKPSNEAFEILKYVLYVNTATPHHRLVKFKPELFEKYLHTKNIQRVAKSYLKRKQYLLWSTAQTSNEADLSSSAYESAILNQSFLYKKQNNSMQEFVNKSRAYRLGKTFNKIILRKRKDFMSSLFKFSNITKKISFYKIQKGLKIIGKYISITLSDSLVNIKTKVWA